MRLTTILTKRPNLDEYDREVIQYEKEITGYNKQTGEVRFKTVEVELDNIQKDFKHSEVLTSIRDQQS